MVIGADGGERPVEVTDLSSGGFKLRTVETLIEGEELLLRVSRYGDFKARIQWVRGQEAGGQFLESVTL